MKDGQCKAPSDRWSMFANGIVHGAVFSLEVISQVKSRLVEVGAAE